MQVDNFQYTMNLDRQFIKLNCDGFQVQEILAQLPPTSVVARLQGDFTSSILCMHESPFRH
jgi:hypothetical protein